MKVEATKAVYRTIGTNDEIPAAKGHIRTELKNLEELELLNKESDDTGKELVWERNFHTNFMNKVEDIPFQTKLSRLALPRKCARWRSATLSSSLEFCLF